MRNYLPFAPWNETNAIPPTPEQIQACAEIENPGGRGGADGGPHCCAGQGKSMEAVPAALTPHPPPSPHTHHVLHTPGGGTPPPPLTRTRTQTPAPLLVKRA